MELIRISEQKLKIMLTPTDMRHFELDPDNFTEDSEGMHRSFHRLLEEVKKQTGFTADDTHISVQYFPSREGGCEMFISAHARAEVPSLPPAKAVQPLKRTSNWFERECAYRFATLDSLLTVCHRLSMIGYIGSNSAYFDEKGRYYLLFTVRSESPFQTPEELMFPGEYGTIENTPLLKIYLSEHGTLICPENAVYRLGQL